ncbi:MAG TPA: hypothetical protein VG347_24425 [Verrucomicrobiae bacterium]|nr:hypothetical protein [Verrucomicrobiae bacterium]
MSHIHRPKPTLSAYQKQLRLMTGLFAVACFLVAGILFWAVNQVHFYIP